MPVFKISRDAYVELEEVYSRVGDLSEDEEEEVVLDLEDAGQLDSVMMGQLVRLQVTLQRSGGRLRLVKLPQQARQMIHHAQLDTLFGLTPPELPRWRH